MENEVGVSLVSKAFKMFQIKDEETDRTVIQFGIRKAKAILDHIEELKQFVEENE